MFVNMCRNASFISMCVYIYIQLLTRSPPPCLFRMNSAIAEFIATGIFGWYQVVLMVRRLPGTTRYQPKILVGMNSAIAELMVTSTTWTHSRANCNSASAELQLCDNSARQNLPSKPAPDSNESQISTCNQFCERRIDFYVVIPCFLRKLASRFSGSATLRSHIWLAVGKSTKQINLEASGGRQHGSNCSKKWPHARARAKF